MWFALGVALFILHAYIGFILASNGDLLFLLSVAALFMLGNSLDAQINRRFK